MALFDIDALLDAIPGRNRVDDALDAIPTKKKKPGIDDLLNAIPAKTSMRRNDNLQPAGMFSPDGAQYAQALDLSNRQAAVRQNQPSNEWLYGPEAGADPMANKNAATEYPMGGSGEMGIPFSDPVINRTARDMTIGAPQALASAAPAMVSQVAGLGSAGLNFASAAAAKLPGMIPGTTPLNSGLVSKQLGGASDFLAKVEAGTGRASEVMKKQADIPSMAADIISELGQTPLSLAELSTMGFTGTGALNGMKMASDRARSEGRPPTLMDLAQSVPAAAAKGFMDKIIFKRAEGFAKMLGAPEIGGAIGMAASGQLQKKMATGEWAGPAETVKSFATGGLLSALGQRKAPTPLKRGVFEADHYSVSPDLQDQANPAIRTDFMGKGLQGSEGKARKNTEGLNADLVYLYGKGATPERRLSKLPKYSTTIEGNILESGTPEMRQVETAALELMKSKGYAITDLNALAQAKFKVAKEMGYDLVKLPDGNAVALTDVPLQKSTKAILRDKDWAIMTAADPGNVTMSPKQNASQNAKMRSQLIKDGFKVEDVTGTYTDQKTGQVSTAPSFLVHGMSESDALGYGQHFGQESVITPKGAVYQDGSYSPADIAGTKFGPDVQGDYTERTYNGKPDRFHIPINFDIRIPAEGPAWDAAPTTQVPLPQEATTKPPWEMTRREFDGQFLYHGTEPRYVGDPTVGGHDRPTFFSPDPNYAQNYARTGKASGIQSVAVVRQSDIDPLSTTAITNGGRNEIKVDAGVRVPIIARLSAQDMADPHRAIVARALADGKPVPQNVLAEYPGLQPLASTPVPAGYDPQNFIPQPLSMSHNLAEGKKVGSSGRTLQEELNRISEEHQAASDKKYGARGTREIPPLLNNGQSRESVQAEENALTNQWENAQDAPGSTISPELSATSMIRPVTQPTPQPLKGQTQFAPPTQVDADTQAAFDRFGMKTEDASVVTAPQGGKTYKVRLGPDNIREVSNLMMNSLRTGENAIFEVRASQFNSKTGENEPAFTGAQLPAALRRLPSTKNVYWRVDGGKGQESVLLPVTEFAADQAKAHMDVPSVWKEVEERIYGQSIPDTFAGTGSKKSGGILNTIASIPGKVQDTLFRKPMQKVIEPIRKAAEAGLNSDNSIVRGINWFVHRLNGGYGVTQSHLDAQRMLKGGRVEAEGMSEDLARGLHEMMPDEGSKNRVLAVYAADHPGVKSENRGLTAEDLTPKELQVLDTLRLVGKAVNMENYGMGQLNPHDFYANKEGKYMPRLYDTFTLAEGDYVPQTTRNSIRLNMGSYKQRTGKVVSEWEKAHAIADPIDNMMVAMGQTLANKAKMTYQEHILHDSPQSVSSTPKPGYIEFDNNPAWGMFAGKHVAKVIAEDLRGYIFSQGTIGDVMRSYSTMAKAYGQTQIRKDIKIMQTSLNPGVQLGNIATDNVWALQYGIDPITYQTSANRLRGSIQGRKDVYLLARRLGLVGGDAISGKEVREDRQGVLGKTTDVIRGFYDRQDDNARLFAIDAWKRQGYSDKDITTMATRAFQTWGNPGAFFDLGADTPLLGSAYARFIPSYLRIVKNQVIDRPLTLIGSMMAWNLFVKTMSQVSGEDPRDRKVREEAPGKPGIHFGFIDIPFTLMTPLGELNVARLASPYYSYAGVTYGTNKPLEFASKMSPYNFQGMKESSGAMWQDPLFGPAMQLIQNSDFRGKAITDPAITRFNPYGANVTEGEKNKNRAVFLVRAFLPQTAKDAQDLGQIIYGGTDYYGKKKNVAQGLLRFVGIRAEDIKPGDEATYKELVVGIMKRYTSKANELKARAGITRKLLQTGKITEERFKSRMEPVLSEWSRLVKAIKDDQRLKDQAGRLGQTE